MKPATVETDRPQETTTTFTSAANYTGDPFTISADGHYVGHDGYVVPQNFTEFYHSQPNYVRRWASKWLNKAEDSEEVRDWEQDLLLYLYCLPQTSKARSPSDRHPEGCRDVIQCFDPYRQYGASVCRFRNYVNICLHNRSLSIVERMRKNPVCRPDNLPFGAGCDSEDDGLASSDEYVHSHSALLQRKSAQQAHVERHLLVRRFTEYVLDNQPEMFDTLVAIAETRTFEEAMEVLEMDEGTFTRNRRRILQLKEAFEDGGPIQKQRKVYKKRKEAAT
jgi:hypothetical protein